MEKVSKKFSVSKKRFYIVGIIVSFIVSIPVSFLIGKICETIKNDQSFVNANTTAIDLAIVLMPVFLISILVSILSTVAFCDGYENK